MAASPTGLRPLPWPRRIWRFWLVAWNFVAIYLGYKRIQKMRWLSEAERAERYRVQHGVTGERLYRLAVRLQGLLIKACQFLSSRADVAPPELVAVLSRLQDAVPPRSYNEVTEQVQRELEATPEEAFASFEREPIAAASLAQVHRARTHDGREVAVKVQYPGISRVVETDLRSIALLIRILARIEPKYDFRMLISEMADYTPRELDFVVEGESAERVARELAHRKDVRVPESCDRSCGNARRGGC